MRGHSGFSLVEALIATTVLAVGVASLAQLFMLAAGSNLAATRRTHATLLASQKLEELRSLDWGTELRDGTSDSVGEYRRRWSVGPLPGYAANAVILDVFVTWNRSRVAHLATIKARRIQ